MQRRQFINNTGKALAASALLPSWIGKDLIIGHGDFRYKIDRNWGKLNSNSYPVKDCHEIVQDSQGRIILLTNHVQNNVIIYDKSGRYLESWGNDYPGAHGLTLKNEGGIDYLYICDTDRHEVIKTTLDGKVVMIIPVPIESEKYLKKEEFLPTETAIADNGDIYIADGYGQQYISHYNSKGELLNIFGGNGDQIDNFQNAHGIAIDNRDGVDKLLITARQQNKFKYFSMSGKYLSEIDLPGAFVCRPVIHRSELYSATIWSHQGAMNTGFISVLDGANKLVSAPGACKPIYKNAQLQSMYQEYKIFDHPHDVCIDEDDNIYVAQWNAGNVYPYKLIRV